jgi:hypothetical protein
MCGGLEVVTNYSAGTVSYPHDRNTRTCVIRRDLRASLFCPSPAAHTQKKYLLSSITNEERWSCL